MKQLIVCPQGSQSPVSQEQITGIPKTHVYITLPQTKQRDLNSEI